jgi:large subunit ribosomal protein L25
MKLLVSDRKIERKSAVKQERKNGRIPAVLYGPRMQSRPISIDRSAFETLLRSIQTQRLSTTFVTLQEGQTTIRALVKGIERHPTTYNVLHLDFLQITEEVSCTVQVPIELDGVLDCVGVKLGGFVRHVIRFLKVRCLPKDLPSALSLPIHELEVGQVKRLESIQIPPRVLPLARMKEVAVVVTKKA